MTRPAFHFDPIRHRLTIDGFQIPSVTQILSGGLPRPALKAWAAKSVAEWAYDHRDAWKDLPREAAVDLLKREPLRFTAKRANVGTAVHAAINAHVEGAEPPELNDEEYGYFNAALAYLTEQRVEVIRSEATVYSRAHAYGGTFDLLARRRVPFGCDPAPATIRDFKTSKAVYPEVALQLVAYARADFIGDAATGEEIPLPRVLEGEIVRLDASGSYEAVPVILDDRVWEAFVAVRSVFEWGREVAPTVLKPALRRGGVVVSERNARTSPDGVKPTSRDTAPSGHSAAPVCSCGQRDAERYPDTTDRVIVPTDAACPVHGVSAADAAAAADATAVHGERVNRREVA